MKVRFLDIAGIELDEAVRWYEEQAPGLGDAFLIEVLLRQTASRAFPRHGIGWGKAFAAAD